MSVAKLDIYFEIHDFDVSPNVLTEKLGFSPTSSHRKGDINSAGLAYRRSLWSLKSNSTEYNDNIEQKWASIQNILYENIDNVKRLNEKYTTTMTVCVVAESGYDKPLVIPASMQRFAGLIGCTVDVDIME